MTAKDKADELIESFRDCVIADSKWEEDELEDAKKAAIICVDEILKYHDECKEQSDCGPLDFMGTGSQESERLSMKEYELEWNKMKLFWVNVKQEINGL